MRTYSDEEIIKAFSTGNESIMKEAYLYFKEPFMAFIRKSFPLDMQRLTELYCDSYTAVYVNVRNGKLQLPLKSSLKTYLFAIGRNQAMKTSRQLARHTHTADIPEAAEAPAVEHLLEYREQRNIVSRLLKKLGDPCSSLLRLFYIDEADYEQISQQLKINNKGTLRKRKFDCLKKMRHLMK